LMGSEATSSRRIATPALGPNPTIRLSPGRLDEGLSIGDSYANVRIEGTARLADLLNHVYVLLPVLDDAKHYWVTRDEIDKLLRRGEGWLRAHPESELITRRYLRHQKALTHEALARLLEEDQPDPDRSEQHRDRQEEQVEAGIGLSERRRGTVASAPADAGAKRVLDLGCGNGRLLQELLKNGSFEKIVGVDVSHTALERAAPVPRARVRVWRARARKRARRPRL
jgi:3' terminal RNA ribose 2'-O-methyltransferase Hen1